jgi:hypothetical protein
VHYLAPEQLESPDEVDHRIDIYAIGVMLYELLTGKLPVGNFEPPSHINPAVDPQIDDIILKALQRRPTSRFQSVDELKSAILGASASPASRSDSAPAIGAATATGPKAINVPFHCEAMQGFSVVHGSMQVHAEGIRIEYRSQDSIFGGWRSRLKTIDAPWDRLTRVEYRPGILNGTMHLMGDSFGLFANFPTNESGSIALKVKHQYASLAESAMQRIQLLRPHLAASAERQRSTRIHANLSIAVTLVLFSILNAGILAVAQTALATSDLVTVWKAMGAVALSVCIGPVLVTQLVCGLLYLTTGAIRVAQLGAFVSMLPLTPLVVVSFPFGAWVRHLLGATSNDVSTYRAAAAKPGWGLTTTIFQIESRHARWVATLETILEVALLIGFGVWVLGYYPHTQRFRIVGDTSVLATQSFIAARLDDIPPEQITIDDSQRLSIRCWRNQKASILERLAITETPTLVILSTESGPDDETGPEDTQPPSSKDLTIVGFVPAVEGSWPAQVVRRETNAGLELEASQEVSLPSDWIASVESKRSRELVITWSREGGNQMRSLMNDRSTKPIFALKVDGWLEAVAADAAIEDKRVRFNWLSDTKRSTASVQAALRGPSAPVHFDPLN